MFVGITNTPRPYAWGSTTAIAKLLGREISGDPEAELWLGAHAGSPSTILDPTQTGGATDLAEWIAADPQTTLGRFAASGRLPFLLKVLAAASPLSLQAHPTLDQAQAGFDRENELGIALDAPQRNYKDAFPKPELIYALSPTFDALCGFRPLDEVRALLHALIEASNALEDPQPQPLEDLLDSLSGSDVALPETFEWLIGRRTGVATLVSLVTTLASRGVAGYDAEMATVSQLAEEYPGDPGIVIALLLNRVTLRAGEALYLPAGNIHAYLSGLGVELMAASDNVLRGGLTPKHIDVPELLDVLDFTPVPVPYLQSTSPSEGVAAFTPDVPDFELVRVDGMFLDASVALTGPAIALCTAGEVSISGSVSSVSLELGDAVFITPDEAGLRFTGSGTVFVATTGA
ncbi:mannose-6-phosphate isomerase, class I [Glaciihabitans sp. INWT7]|uniref:mannose-6-phosphate isomerase, class I n=1 Tax=Glaciihabitans sp. INWT7 TaxID=2596912 RepID=UPI001626FC91|nr:mannose-6-phosphate isomerase, class I [Glaciihabitans sp. INWT7]QNE46000.1 mannose-6-phosphate isomerase, class I [Glaciihabitans sp. INWT7]